MTDMTDMTHLTGRMPFAFDRSVRHKDEDGRLHVAVTNISKAAVNPYRGNEIPGWETLGLDPDRIYHLLRHPDELAAGAATFNNLPLLSQHVAVSARDPKENLVAGSTGTDAVFEPPFLRNSLVVWRQEDIDDIESRDKCELSCAYRYDPDMTPGQYKGVNYDGVMRNIRGNHVALVEAGRAGPDVMVHDSKEGIRMPSLNSRKALMVKGALVSYLKPKLMAGTSLALDAALSGITRANWATEKPKLAAAVLSLAKPKLAADASMEDMHKFLDRLDNEEDGEASDDDLDDDPDAEDEEETEKESEEERKKREAKDKAKDGKARDMKAKDAEKDDDDDKKTDAKDAKAMDAAITAATTKLRADLTAAAEARDIVRPFIGNVPVTMDSAEAIFKLALDHAGVNLDGVPPAAYRAILSKIPNPNARQPLAMDAAATGGMMAKFSGAAARITLG